MRANRAALLVGLSLTLSGFAWGSVARKVEEGNRLYQKGRYGEALNRYSDAQQARPDSPEIPFNIGDSFYRLKRYGEAIEAHTRSASSLDRKGKNPLQAKAAYNVGSSLFRQGKLKEALEAYQRAIDLESGDIDTKYNIELIQRKLKEEQKQESRSKDETRQQRQEKPEEEAGGQKGEGQKESERDSRQERQRPEDSESERRAQSLPRGGISREDAERLLGTLQAEEERVPVTLEEKEGPSVDLPPEKDW